MHECDIREKGYDWNLENLKQMRNTLEKELFAGAVLSSARETSLEYIAEKLFGIEWGRIVIRQGQVCANGIVSIGQGVNATGITLTLAVFPELYAIVALAATFMIGGAVA